ncbi:MAG: DUF4124 domain-containing protein [Sideroxydans sp.]|nr:DUF4124 domain-containing protein [Sideroxydans sp.]
MKFWIFGLAMLFLSAAHADGLYRWVDQAGKVHYGDVPANDAEQLQERKFDKPATPLSGDAALPYEVRRARQRFPVTLYVEQSCTVPCQQAREFLQQRHIPFTEKNLVTKEETDAFKQDSGSDILPAITVGSHWLKGFFAKAWQDELDAAGYPR